MCGIGDDKSYVHAVTLQATVFHHTANAEGTVLWRLASSHLRGRKKEHQILFKRTEHQRSGGTNNSQRPDNQGKSFMTWFHVSILPISGADVFLFVSLLV
jgi:hypothetical protein